MAERTPRKPWEPGQVLLGMALLAAIGVGAMMTGVFVIPGAALLAYATVFGLVEAVEHGWNALERFTDWWMDR